MGDYLHIYSPIKRVLPLRLKNVSMPVEVDGLYQCDECKLFYRDLDLAQKCEDWCKEHNSCNIEISAQSVSPTHLRLS
jgi:hypothetical protein